ncbi:MAG TPA: threonine/serine dehydratase [Hyphomicrobiales bacterium]|nr:threonine/serine dehydratase [Hyphomicrobiales bacterium]
MASALPVTIADVEAAAVRLRGQALTTPLVSNPLLDERVGAHVLLKLETLQRCGSFKFRGAFNKLAALEPETRRRGVVAWSSGNHAQGVAAAAKIHGVPALIVMPADTPKVKVAATEGYGAEVRFYDRWTESREEIGHAIAKERGAVIVPPYDDPLVVAGQGTVGLEIAEQAKAFGVAIDHVLAPASGGGLIAGIATALADRSPATRAWCVEPAAFDDHRRSLAAGHRVANDPAARSICDALLASTPGEITFAINRERLSGGLAVGDGEALDAVAYAARTLKLVVEPGGAVALAAVLTGKLDVTGKTVAVVLSGGNIDPPVLAEALGRP